jgi:hypothetical protein
MPTAPTPAESAASRTNCACSRGFATPEGKARAARNATRRGLRGTAEPDIAARIRWLTERIEARLRENAPMSCTNEPDRRCQTNPARRRRTNPGGGCRTNPGQLVRQPVTRANPSPCQQPGRLRPGLAATVASAQATLPRSSSRSPRIPITSSPSSSTHRLITGVRKRAYSSVRRWAASGLMVSKSPGRLKCMER